jgi:hypothetical protein
MQGMLDKDHADRFPLIRVTPRTDDFASVNNRKDSRPTGRARPLLLT